MEENQKSDKLIVESSNCVHLINATVHLTKKKILFLVLNKVVYQEFTGEFVELSNVILPKQWPSDLFQLSISHDERKTI